MARKIFRNFLGETIQVVGEDQPGKTSSKMLALAAKYDRMFREARRDFRNPIRHHAFVSAVCSFALVISITLTVFNRMDPKVSPVHTPCSIEHNKRGAVVVCSCCRRGSAS